MTENRQFGRAGLARKGWHSSDTLQGVRAVLVLFNSISLDLFNTTLEALTQGLTPAQTLQDGALYTLSP